MNIWLTEIWQAWRASFRKPGFLLLATGVLALGIGASVAVFALIDNSLLKPLPFAQPARLLMVGGRAGDHYMASARIVPLLQRVDGVRSLGMFRIARPTNVVVDDTPRQVSTMPVSRGLIPTLGLHMAVGRNFTVAEEAADGPAAILLTYGFWVRQFHADPDVLGRRIEVEGKPRTIVGVLPQRFAPIGATADWQGKGIAMALPLVLPDVATSPNADNLVYMMVARLAQGVGVDAASAEFDSRVRAFYTNAGLGDRGRALAKQGYGMAALAGGLHSMRSLAHTAQSVPVLLLFLAAAALVLLIAVVNLSSLMKLRAIAHMHQRAVRHALGAGRLRQILPVLAEGFMIGVFGAILGLILVWVGLASLDHVLPAKLVGDIGFNVSVRAYVLAFSVGVAAALVASIVGVTRVHSEAAMDGLRVGDEHGLGRAGLRLGRVLVVVQVTLTTVLLSLAGLFLHTLYDAAHVPLGFQSEHVLTFRLSPVQATYPDPEAIRTMSDEVLQRLRAIPGADGATMATGFPVNSFSTTSVTFSPQDTENVRYQAVVPGFFATYGIPVQRGRPFAQRDRHGAAQVVMANHAFAQKYLRGQALDAVVHLGNTAAHVIGVVGDVRQDGPLAPAEPMIFQPLSQLNSPFLYSQLSFALRVHGDPWGYRRAVHAAVAEAAPAQPIFDLQPLHVVIGGTTSMAQLTLLLAGIFATLGLLLSAAGLYVVMAVSVAAREHEFGVRMALGCAPLRLLRLVLRDGVWQIAAGLVVGFAAALALAQVLRAVLVHLGGQHVLDAVVLVGVGGLLLLAGLLACLIPALRAARVQPMHALRGE